MITPTLNLMTTAVKKASHRLTRDFNELEYLLDNPTSAKEFALRAQQNCQQSLYKDISRFKQNYNYDLYNVEYIKNKDESNCFCLQGIVGLENFTKAIPNFAIAIHLLRDNKVFASVVYNPITLEIFTAEQNEGAFYNSKKLRFNSDRIFAKDSVAINNPALSHIDLNSKKNIKITGSINLDLCYIAAQKINSGIFYSISNKMIRGSLLLIEEAKIPFKIDIKDNTDRINSLIINP